MGDAKVVDTAPMVVTTGDKGWDWYYNHYQMVEKDWRDRRERYQKFYAMLVAKAGANPVPYLSNLRSHLIQQQVGTYQNFLLTALLPSFPYIYAETVEPYRTYPNFAIESETTEEINARLRRAKFYDMMGDWIRSAVTNGVGFLKMVNGNFRIVDPSNAAWDLSCSGDIRNDAGFFIERITHMDLMTVKALFKQGVFNKLTGDKFKQLVETAPEPDDTADYNADKEFRNRAREWTTSTRYWGNGLNRRIEIEQITTPSRRMWVCRTLSMVLGDVPNNDGYINYYALRPFPEVNEVQGWALPEMLEDIQEELNANLAQSIDNTSLASNVMLKVRRNSGLDPFNLRVQPGKVFPVNNPDDIEFFQPNFHGRELYNQRGELQLDADRLSGVMAQTRGESGPASMKATVASILNTNVNVRLNATANRLIDMPIRDLINDFMRAVSNDPDPVKVTQMEWDAIRSVINIGMMEMVPQPEAYVGNQLARQQTMINTLQVVGPRLGPRGYSAFVQDIVLLSGMRDPERVTQDLAPAMPQDVQAGAQALGTDANAQLSPGGAGAFGGSPTGIPQIQANAQGLAPGAPPQPPGIQG